MKGRKQLVPCARFNAEEKGETSQFVLSVPANPPKQGTVRRREVEKIARRGALAWTGRRLLAAAKRIRERDRRREPCPEFAGFENLSTGERCGFWPAVRGIRTRIIRAGRRPDEPTSRRREGGKLSCCGLVAWCDEAAEAARPALASGVPLFGTPAGGSSVLGGGNGSQL